jgi:hypothetical protein
MQEIHILLLTAVAEGGDFFHCERNRNHLCAGSFSCK